MYAVIMAGGKGTRLSSVIKDIPKPMALIAGRPLLEYQIENLKENGIVNIVIIVGYLGHIIKDYFKDGASFGVSITYICEETPLGTAGALPYLRNKLDKDFILLFGDLFICINFRRFYKYHIDHKATVTLYAHPNAHPYDSDLIITDGTGLVKSWNEKNSKRRDDYFNLVNAGVYVISPDLLNFISKGQKTDLEKDVIRPLLINKTVYAYSCTEYVKDIGTPERLMKVESDYKKGICEKRNLKNKQKCIFLDRDGTINKYKGLLTQKDQMELEHNAANAIRLINESEYLVIVITNQPVLARGDCTKEELDKIHKRMHTLLGEQGAYLDALYYCPHHPHRGYDGEILELKIKCNCRKPDIGMLLQAQEDYYINLQDSWFVGDTTTDLQTGKNAKMHTALVLTGEAGNDKKFAVSPDITGKDLLSCVMQILQKGTKI